MQTFLTFWLLTARRPLTLETLTMFPFVSIRWGTASEVRWNTDLAVTGEICGVRNRAVLNIRISGYSMIIKYSNEGKPRQSDCPKEKMSTHHRDWTPSRHPSGRQLRLSPNIGIHHGVIGLHARVFDGPQRDDASAIHLSQNRILRRSSVWWSDHEHVNQLTAFKD